MSGYRPLHEDYELSCNVLSELLSNAADSALKELLLLDFISKYGTLRSEAQAYYLTKVLRTYVSETVKDLMSESSPATLQPKPRADIAVVTVIKPELLAAQIAFGIEPSAQENWEGNGLRYWETRLLSANVDQPLRIVITMVGEGRNVPMANACHRLFHVYDVGTCILVGIAGGLKSHVKLGDVVVAEDMVLDYEGQRLEGDGPKKRPKPYPLQTAIKRDLEHFDPDQTSWKNAFESGLQILRKDRKLPVFPEDWQSDYKTGVILAGEKLLADGSLPKLQAEYSERVRAVEMEGSGFASACDEYSIPWLIFRGISDYGDRDKTGMDAWQPVAALAAATCAMEFLKQQYRKRQLKRF